MRILIEAFVPLLAVALAGAAMPSPTPSPGASGEPLRAPAAGDSLVGVAGAGADSMALAGADSLLAAPADSLASAGPARGTVRRQKGALEGPWLDRLKPEDLSQLVAAVPGAWVFLGGDPAMPSFLTLDPFGGGAPTLRVDGIPVGGPADLDPALFDISALPIASVRSSVDSAGVEGAGPALWMHSREAEPGRNRLDSRFSSTVHETFQRAVSVRTPASERELRLDFEEWKTEEGFDYTRAPGVVSSFQRGRAKMRRFDLGVRLETAVGRLRFDFGRGRRFARGHLANSLSAERWTGRWALGLRSPSAGVTLWHFDTHDDDEGLDQRIDGSTLGLRADGTGPGVWSAWRWELEGQRWGARYEIADSLQRRVRGTHVLRGAVGRRVEFGRTDLGFRAEAAWSERLDELAPAGALWCRHAIATGWSAELRAERRLRVPRLAESDGRFRIDALAADANGLIYRDDPLQWWGAGDLHLEKRDRASAALVYASRSTQASLSLDRWRLRDGVGWDALGDTARVRGGVESEAWGLRAGWRRVRGHEGWRILVSVDGVWLFDPPIAQAGLGSSVPERTADLRLTVSRPFFAPHNRLGLSVDLRTWSAHGDPLRGPWLNGVRLPSSTRVDLRAWLKIRDAELGIAYDNLADATIEEVAGTQRRPRQLRWTLSWPFRN